MRSYSQFGILRNLSDLEAAQDKLHRSPVVLVLCGEETAPCGRGKMFAACASTASSFSLGGILFVWGTDDEEVSILIAQGARRICFVGADGPGTKSAEALDKLKRAGSDVMVVGPEVEGVARVDCEGDRSGKIDLLVESKWQDRIFSDKPENEASKPKPKPKPKKKKKKPSKSGN